MDLDNIEADVQRQRFLAGLEILQIICSGGDCSGQALQCGLQQNVFWMRKCASSA